MGRLDGKVAIVTGAARGTGEAIARLMVAEGAKVVLGDILDQLGQELASNLGKNAVYCHLDVTKEKDWRYAIEVSQTFGALNVLVNNAAVLHIAPIAQTTVEEYRRVIEVNEIGTFLGVREAIEPMKLAGGGSISIFLLLMAGMCHPVLLPTPPANLQCGVLPRLQPLS